MAGLDLTKYKEEIQRIQKAALADVKQDLDYKAKRAENEMQAILNSALAALSAAEEASKINITDMLEGKIVYKTSFKTEPDRAAFGGDIRTNILQSGFLKLQPIPAGEYDALVILSPKGKKDAVKA